MNLALPPRLDSITKHPFADAAPTASEHFRMALFGVIAHLIESCTEGGRAAALAAHPFLEDYVTEIAERLQSPDPSAAEWRRALETWEIAVPSKLPLRALFLAGLSRLELELLLAAGLPEEDPRFSDLFERATGRERRATSGMLLAWWRFDEDGGDRADEVRRSVLALIRAGLLQVLNPE